MPGKMPLSEEETAKIEQVVAAYTLDLNEGSEWFSFGTNHRRRMRKIQSNLIVPLLHRQRWYPASHQLDIGRRSKWVHHEPSFPGYQLGSQPECKLWEKLGFTVPFI
ncbi:hypothetical protein B0H14DRAFT_3123743 [Mycena olivaceomarginata]|nr:hypothetical protein B0H14DRAFT_3123743 [Mycena olivaceomarginata]